MEPSVRGSLFVTMVVTLRRDRDAGIVSQDALAARLGPMALESLDEKIDVERWYPIGPYREMLDAAWELVGRGRIDYLQDLGAKTAARFLRANAYAQLDYAKRVRRPGGRSALLRQVRLIMTLSDSLYNFVETEVRVEEPFLRVFFSNVSCMSEAFRHATEGFVNEIDHQRGMPPRWTSESVSPDRVCLQLVLPDRISRDD